MPREDQNYIIDLCDEVLNMKALHEHTFDFLRGDPSLKRPNGTKLPVDAWYPELNLVIEFEEIHHSKPNVHFDKPFKMTISGTNRGEQRVKYIKLRKIIFPKHKIRVLFIPYDKFELKGKKLKRIKDEDMKVVRELLKDYIQNISNPKP
jgi:hypothetical protein